MLRSGRRETSWSRGGGCLFALAALSALVVGPRPLAGQPAVPRPAGDVYWRQRGAVTLAGVGPAGAAPLRGVSALALGDALRFWDLQPPAVRGTARTTLGAGTTVLGGPGGAGPVGAWALL